MAITTLFLDMNAYFASVEQQECPAYRGRPIGIVPVMTDSTCCIAASYEARSWNVKTGTMVGEARRLCPHLILVEARPEVYVRTHNRILDTVRECVHVSAVHSIDEMSCRLLSNERAPQTALRLAQEVKRRLREEVGPYLRCSIGLGPNYLLAKVASNMEKPDGLTMIQMHELPHKLHRLQLDDFPGISRRMVRRLANHHVNTVAQLCALSEERMERIWGGIVGRRWWHWLRGEDVDLPPTQRRTVGHMRVLPPEYRTDERAEAMLHHLIHKAAARLRRLGYWAGRMHLHVRCRNNRGWEREIRLGLCQDTLTMLEVFHRVWPRRLPDVPLRVGITLTHLTNNASATWPLFCEDRRRLDLCEAIDAINLRFGQRAIYFGGMYAARKAVPTRISFTQIPDLQFGD